MGENSFAPDAPVTREQLSLILYGYARYKGYDTSASVSLSGYADRDRRRRLGGRLHGLGRVRGPDLRQHRRLSGPAGTATRAEVAQDPP